MVGGPGIDVRQAGGTVALRLTQGRVVQRAVPFYRGWRMAGSGTSQSPILTSGTTYSVSEAGLGYSGVWQDNFGSSSSGLYYASHLTSGGQPSEDSGFSMSSAGLVIGKAAAGRPVRIECQIALSANTSPPFPRIALLLSGVDGVEPETVIPGVSSSLEPNDDGVSPHSHQAAGNQYRLQVGVAWIFDEDDVIVPKITQSNVASDDMRFDTHLVSEGRAERCFILATVLA